MAKAPPMTQDAGYMTVNAAADLLDMTRHNLMMACLHHKIEYRPSGRGIELVRASVERFQKAAAPPRKKAKKSVSR